MPVEKWSERIYLVKPTNAPVFAEDMDQVHEAAETATPTPHVVVDLAGMEYLNSSNLSQMLRLRKVLIERGGRLRLAGPPDGVWALFLATGLDKVFEFATDTSTALADIQIS